MMACADVVPCVQEATRWYDWPERNLYRADKGHDWKVGVGKGARFECVGQAILAAAVEGLAPCFSGDVILNIIHRVLGFVPFRWLLLLRVGIAGVVAMAAFTCCVGRFARCTGV